MHFSNFSFDPVAELFSFINMIGRNLIHRSATARCRTLPSPRRRQIPIAAVASLWTRRRRSMPISLQIACSPPPPPALWQMLGNSASAELRATVLCVLLEHFKTWLQILATPPDVERRVRIQPPEFVFHLFLAKCSSIAFSLAWSRFHKKACSHSSRSWTWCRRCKISCCGCCG